MGIETIHESYVKSRRLNVLANHFAELIPAQSTVLDVGSGDGGLAAAIIARKPTLRFRGFDTLVREDTKIPVEEFDGRTIPAENDTTDYVLFSDVLHHTEDPMILLREAARVACKGVMIKDHLVCGLLARPTLRFMDEVGNRRFGVKLPHNYWRPEQWNVAFEELRLERKEYRTQLGLYPFWANWCFGRGLHFITRLGLKESNASQHADRSVTLSD
ncbi:MAG: SAM-dependent methyltransferase [Planctomycetaceae bacterium TMED240]|nr:SAM-dependent methyltransferase [Rhodopirellula sp.]OUX06933.1 MAG: SAM-dependent methyltransferase [Planctomycetaceae bacterium TMED240]